jgi:hypothetical protein
MLIGGLAGGVGGATLGGVGRILSGKPAQGLEDTYKAFNKGELTASQATELAGRRALPTGGLGTGLAMVGVPAAAGAYMLGNKAIDTVKEIGGGQGAGGMGFIPNLAMAGVGAYGGMKGMEYLAQQAGLPDWTKWLGLVAGGTMLPGAVGGMV